MSVTRHWWLEVADDGAVFDVLESVPTVQAEGHRLIEVVPAEQLQGAVERIAGLTPPRPTEFNRDAAQWEAGYKAAVADALAAIRGQ